MDIHRIPPPTMDIHQVQLIQLRKVPLKKCTPEFVIPAEFPAMEQRRFVVSVVRFWMQRIIIVQSREENYEGKA